MKFQNFTRNVVEVKMILLKFQREKNEVDFRELS